VSVASAEPAVATDVDAFVCYSRADRAFVERLHAVLVESGRDIYVDWEDIPSWSPDYESDLFDAIDRCSTFLFILSPDSLTSPNCKLELEHAVEQGKRIRPLLRRDVAAAAAPDALRRPQWIDFSRDDLFDQACEELGGALGVDADWVRNHTRIGLRASEWQRNGRDRSFLLRGSDLRDSESWLTGQAAKEPPATALQLEYVAASRHESRRRQQKILAAVVLALVVSIALAVFALLQRQTAVKQRNVARTEQARAERAARVATSRELAASANSQLGTDPELSLLLSLRAYRRAPTAEAEAALRRSLLASKVRKTFRYSDWFRQAVFSPNGKSFILVGNGARVVQPVTWRTVAKLSGPTKSSSVEGVSFSRGGGRALTINYSLDSKRSIVRVWNTRTWMLISQLGVATNDELTNAVMSPDGRFIAASSPNVRAAGPRVWNLAARRWVRLGTGHQRLAGVAPFSPDGRSIATVGDDSRVRIWDSATGKLLSEPRGNVDWSCADNATGGVSFTPNGRFLALACAARTVAIVEAATGRVVARLGDRSSDGTVFSPNGRWLLTTHYDSSPRVWAVGTWRLAAVLRGHTGQVTDAKFSGNGRVVVTASSDGTARAWEVGTWHLLTVLKGHTQPLLGVTVSPNGRYVVTWSQDATARVWELASGNGITDLPGFGDSGGGAALPDGYSPDGGLVATRSSDGVVEVWELVTRRKVADLGHGNFLGFSPDGKHAFTTGARSAVEMWDTRTWRKRAELRGHKADVLDIAFSPRGKWIATAGGYDYTARIWDAHTGRPVAVLKGHSGRVTGVAFSPDGRWVGTSSYDKTAAIWDTASWRRVAALRGHTEEVWSIQFSPDSRRVVTASMDDTSRVWAVGTWRTVARLRGHRGEVVDASFSPTDGRLVVTSSWDDTARTWDAETGRTLHRLRGHTDIVHSARFSPDGKLIATAGGSTVRIWDARTGRLATVLNVVAPGLVDTGDAKAVDGALFSPDGRSLLVASNDGITHIYNWELFAPVRDLLRTARARTTRKLSRQERKTYLHES
jgi:WD40 repeat protein